MGDFNDIVPKRLNFVPARRATIQEAQSAPIPFDKYYALRPTRAIKKIKTYLDLPAFNVPPLQEKYWGQLLFQYNLIAPSSFYLLNPIIIDPSFTGTLCIKWRVNMTVHRYLIGGFQSFQGIDYHTFPVYHNQLIPHNCVIEFWGMPTLTTQPGINQTYKLIMNFLSNPIEVDETEINIAEAAPLLNDAMGHVFPIALPIAQPLLAHLSN